MSTTDVAVQDTALLQVEQLQQIVSTAPQILQQNIESKTKAIEAGNTLIAQIHQTGMDDVIDDRTAKLITKIKGTVDIMNERRKPFTQIVDAVKKQFTTAESELKPVIEELQELRNVYATEKMKRKQEEERQAMLKLQKDKEVIEIRQNAEVTLSNFFNECILKTKQNIAKYFNELTLETIGKADNKFATSNTDFYKKYQIPVELKLTLPIHYNTQDEVNAVILEVLVSSNHEQKTTEYSKAIQATIQEYRDKLPSKQAELEAIAKAGAEEKERMEAEAKKRAEAEQAQLILEQQERERKAQEDAAINATAATAEEMVDANVNVSETPKVKEGYEIKLKNNAGYLLLIQFWFEKEGKALTADKLEKYTFDRVKRFCEGYAIKNEEFIQSPLISYEPIYKAK